MPPIVEDVITGYEDPLDWGGLNDTFTAKSAHSMEGRLYVINKIRSKRRKLNSMINEQERAKLNIYTKLVDKYKDAFRYRVSLEEKPYKQSLSEIQGIKASLRMVRQRTVPEIYNASLTDSRPVNYESITLRGLRRQVENCVHAMNPERIRAKKTSKLLREGTMNGKILDHEEAKTKFNEIMTRNKDFLPKVHLCTPVRKTKEAPPGVGLLLPPIEAFKKNVAHRKDKKEIDNDGYVDCQSPHLPALGQRPFTEFK